MTSERQQELAEVFRFVDGSQSLPKLVEFVERLNISADAKSLLMDVARVTVKIGTRILQIGRCILSFAVDTIRNYPNTSFGAVIALVLSSLVAAIPLVGPILAPLLAPLLLAFGFAAGALTDMVSGPARTRIRELELRFSILSGGQ